MVLFWIVNLSSNSSNACAVLDEYIFVRPPAPPGFIQANIAISVIGCVLIALSQLWWIRLRNEPHLLSRPMISTVFLNLAFFLQIWVTCIRRTVFDANGHANMPCHLHALLWFLIGPLFSIAVFFRMFFVATRLRFTKAAAQRHKLDLTLDDSQSAHSTEPHNRQQDFAKFKAIFKLAFGLSSDQKRPTSSNSALVAVANGSEERNFAPVDPHEGEDLDRELRMLGAASKTETLLMLTVIWSSPNLVFIIILFAAFPVYHGNCYGCDMSFELLIAMSLANPVIIWSTYKVRKLLVGATDPEGVLREMNLSEKNGATLLMIVCWFLLGFDPSFYDYQQYLAYEWLQVLGIFMIWFVLVFMPLVRAERNHYTRQVLHRKSAVVDKFDIRYLTTESVFDVLRDPVLSVEFEKFAVQEMIVESVRFLQDSAIWKKLFLDKAVTWRRAKAKIIMQTYVYSNAPLQINISSAEREMVEKAFNLPEVREDLFEPAVDSIALMLKQGALIRFLKQRRAIDGKV